MRNGIKKICPQGHVFYKSSSCPVCPACEVEKSERSVFSQLAAPARRALEAQGIKNLRDLAAYSETDLLNLHGFGPGSLPTLRKLLSASGLSLKN